MIGRENNQRVAFSSGRCSAPAVRGLKLSSRKTLIRVARGIRWCPQSQGPKPLVETVIAISFGRAAATLSRGKQRA